MENKKNPLKILITGAAGQISYSLLPLLANGNVFGKVPSPPPTVGGAAT